MAYKDSMFRSLFGNKKSALELYNALHGTDYSERDTEIIINTLSEAVFSPQKNDLSFIINGKLVVMVEHQSTINENMPFRFLPPQRARLAKANLPYYNAVTIICAGTFMLYSSTPLRGAFNCPQSCGYSRTAYRTREQSIGKP